MVQAVHAHKPSSIHTNTRKNTPINTWRTLCQSHSRYSHLSKESDGGTGMLQEERDGEPAPRSDDEKGEEKKDEGTGWRGSICKQ